MKLIIVSYRYLQREDSREIPSFITDSFDSAKEQIAKIHFPSLQHKYKDIQEFKKSFKCQFSDYLISGKIQVEEDDLYILKSVPCY